MQSSIHAYRAGADVAGLAVKTDDVRVVFAGEAPFAVKNGGPVCVEVLRPEKKVPNAVKEEADETC